MGVKERKKKKESYREKEGKRRRPDDTQQPSLPFSASFPSTSANRIPITNLSSPVAATVKHARKTLTLGVGNDTVIYHPRYEEGTDAKL